jgi:putative FmdB family regulatory protein
MPTYDYKCRGCGHAFDELQSFSDPPLTKCPACKKNKLDRLFGGGGAIIFKGSGFYETDYRRAGTNGQANGKPEAEAAPAESKAEAKTDAKPDTKAESAPAVTDPAAPASSGTKSEKSGGSKKVK